MNKEKIERVTCFINGSQFIVQTKIGKLDGDLSPTFFFLKIYFKKKKSKERKKKPIWRTF